MLGLYSTIELQPQSTCFIDVKGSSVILACMWAFVCGGSEGIRPPGGEGTKAETARLIGVN